MELAPAGKRALEMLESPPRDPLALLECIGDLHDAIARAGALIDEAEAIRKAHSPRRLAALEREARRRNARVEGDDET